VVRARAGTALWATSLATIGIVGLTHCGPVQSTSTIVDAAAELEAAKTARGDETAPFEYTAAEAYLHKAREEQSYADFETAVRYAQKSRDCARAARQISEAQTKESLKSTRPSSDTQGRCRPGPVREPAIPDAQEEPNAEGAPGFRGKSTGAVIVKAPPSAQPIPAQKSKGPVKPNEPKEPEDPLPEGDATGGTP
jgi:hypothetical protein